MIRYTDASDAWESANEAQRDALSKQLAEADAIIINCFGLLSSIYRYGKVAYVGGGFGVGIHNVLEAAVWGMPVIFGPNHERFQEAVALIAEGGGFSISDTHDFEIFMRKFSSDPKALAEASRKAGEYVKSQSGATDAVMRVV